MTYVKIIEIGPRDGFQSINDFIPTQIKKEVIRSLINAGVPKIQIGSFVSSKAIPQMSDIVELTEYVMALHPKAELFALVPNFFGAKKAIEAGLTEISPVMSLTESHNKANLNRSMAESIEEIKRIRETFPDIKITQDLSMVFGCPFEGYVSIETLLDLLAKLNRIGIRHFTLCDTIGIAYPAQVKNVMLRVTEAFPDVEFGIHIHDTRNMGILNSFVGIMYGASFVQTTLGGLGGCPFAPGATGNTSTEDFVYTMIQEGFETGIDFPKLLAAAKELKRKVPGNYSGHHINIEF